MNKRLEVLIPVKNEAENVNELLQRLHVALTKNRISYTATFIDDRSDDKTVTILRRLQKKYPIKILRKKGKPGKAYCILEGAKAAKSNLLAMIDGDLQYPPEALPEMVKLSGDYGVVVANRVKHNTSLVRKIGSILNMYIFEKFLNGFNCDTQSGLKVFRKDIIERISEDEVAGWAVDMPLLATATDLGHQIGTVEIEFAKRSGGKSKINFFNASFEIAWNAIKLRFRRHKPLNVLGKNKKNAIGSGVIYKGKSYITHTHLDHELSALETVTVSQKLVIGVMTLLILTGLFFQLHLTAIIVIAILSAIYFSDLIFSTIVLLKSLHVPPEIKVSEEELGNLSNRNLPIYSILCPMYKEAQILPEFLESINKINWPKNKLDVLLLLEEDDKETISAAKKTKLPPHVKTIIVPHSFPKTKPKACNYGLHHAKGEYVVIYDAEDHPDPLQLKKSFLAFQKVPSDVFCLQSKLNYHNSDQNLLTRLFTTEYTLWFELILPGLQSIETAIPLGGTSNHFRTKDLIKLHAWDPFNVTEDADLGVRLFKEGYRTAIIDSTTLEEANSNFKNWLRQRSRWIKGYLQTYFIHMRSPRKFFKTQGIHALLFQLIIGMRMVFILVNPILWVTTISYFTMYALVGPAIESLFPAPVFYMAAISLIFGNFIHLYNYMIALGKRENWSLVKYTYLAPFYWLMMSWAAIIAIYQLVVKPHYWEKTNHGLHLGKKQTKGIELPEFRLPTFKIPALPVPSLSFGAINFDSALVGAFGFVSASTFMRIRDFQEGRFDTSAMGLVVVFTSFYYAAKLLAELLVEMQSPKNVDLKDVDIFHKALKKKVRPVYLFAMLIWLLVSPQIATLFQMSYLPLLIFSTIFIFVFMDAINKELLSVYGKTKANSILSVFELALLTFLTIVLSAMHLGTLVFIVVPASSLFVLTIRSRLTKENTQNGDGGGKEDLFMSSVSSLKAATRNLSDFTSLFTGLRKGKTKNEGLKILVFNWRDTKHVWAGGAEIYVHEIAKRWVAEGHSVTLFCGHDGNSKLNETVEGVNIIRRGGFYTVYIWAFVYYILKLRGKYDVIVESENGVPFFTPLYSRLPVILVAHHVNQNVFRENLPRILSSFAQFIEKYLMPLLYREKVIVTVSESSKKDFIKLGFTTGQNIYIVPPCVNSNAFSKTKKTAHPSFIYMGRLKPYKNIDIAIKAFAQVHSQFPKSKLTIAGDGESRGSLSKLVKSLRLKRSVTFTGRISEQKKAQLLAKSWIALQPSSFEGWGITVIEANASGTPVIASKVNGLRDSVIDGKTGILVPVKDPGEMAKAMQMLISKPKKLMQLSRNASEWAKSFDWDNSANTFLSIVYKTLEIQAEEMSGSIALVKTEV